MSLEKMESVPSAELDIEPYFQFILRSFFSNEDHIAPCDELLSEC
jgi:hypothetical protein